MNEVVPLLQQSYLSDLSRTPRSIVAQSAGEDFIKRKEKIVYLKVDELERGWAFLYEQHINKAIWDEDYGVRAAEQIRAAIQDLDAVVLDMGDVLHEHRRIVTALEKLAIAVREPRKKYWRLQMPRFSWPSREKVEERRLRDEASKRDRIREHRNEITRAFTIMRDKVKNPFWFRRQFDRVIGRQHFQINVEEAERLKPFAVEALSGLGLAIGRKVGIDNDVLQAFSTLGLVPWATQEEKQKQYYRLLKVAHPDKPDGNTKRAQELNDANEVLDRFFYKGGASRIPGDHSR